MSVVPRQEFVPVLGPRGFYRLAYREWGDPANDRVLVCVHGSFRNGRDFDHVARALCDHWRVVCPDMPGRGASDWWENKLDYTNLNFVATCASLIARLGVDTVDWLGTSMGGLIGILLASLPNAPIARMVINDIGPFVNKPSRIRIAAGAGLDPRFASVGEAEAIFRKVVTTFGLKRDEHWRHFTEISLVPDGHGKLRMHYDQGAWINFKSEAREDILLWPEWDAIRCPVLALRGADSDLFLPETAEEMKRRGPKTDIVTFAGCGHAPALMEEDQIAVVRGWLAKPI